MKVDETSRYLASYLIVNQTDFIEWVEGCIDPTIDLDCDKLAETIQEFFNTLP